MTQTMKAGQYLTMRVKAQESSDPAAPLVIAGVANDANTVPDGENLLQ